MDWELVARELVRALRGRRSQVALSKRLGYRTNVIYRWEAGRDFPTAAKLMSLAARTGIDVDAALERFHPGAISGEAGAEATHPATLARMLDELRGGTSIVALAAATGYSRFQVARWLDSATEPRLPEFLALIEASSLRLLDFVHTLVDPAHLPSFAAAWRDLEATRRAAHDAPWTQAVLRCLDLHDYAALPKHVDGWVATRLGVELDEEQRCLKLLAASGQIRWEGDHWRVARVLSVDTRRDPDSTRRLRGFWTGVAHERTERGQAAVASYNVFGVSKKDLARLRELHASYFAQMRAIVAQSEPVERVALASLQLVPLDVGDAPIATSPTSRPPALATTTTKREPTERKQPRGRVAGGKRRNRTAAR